MKYCANALLSVFLACGLLFSMPLEWAYQKSPVESTNVWTSVTTGKEYTLTADGDHLYINGILPAALKEQGESFRCDLVRQEAVWLGTCIAYLPYRSSDKTEGHQTHLCRIETKEKISVLTKTRIEGEFETLDNTQFDFSTCTFKKGPMKHFAWIPKK